MGGGGGEGGGICQRMALNILDGEGLDEDRAAKQAL